MISREVVEHKYVFLYLGEDWKSIGYDDPIKFEYDDSGEDVKFWVPETPETVMQPKKKLLAVFMKVIRKGRFGRKKEAYEYMPLRSFRIGKNMLAAVLANAKENGKK